MQPRKMSQEEKLEVIMQQENERLRMAKQMADAQQNKSPAATFEVFKNPSEANFRLVGSRKNRPVPNDDPKGALGQPGIFQNVVEFFCPTPVQEQKRPVVRSLFANETNDKKVSFKATNVTVNNNNNFHLNLQNLSFTNIVKNVIPSVGPYIEPTLKAIQGAAKSAARPADQVLQTAIPTWIGMLILTGSLLAYNILYYLVKAYVSIWLVQAFFMFLGCYMSVFKLRLKPTALLVACMMTAYGASTLDDDLFVKSEIADRMNQDFYQEFEYQLNLLDPTATGLDSLFAMRKVVNSCNKNFNSDLCKEDLKEAEVKYKSIIPALIATLKNSRVVEPRNAMPRVESDGEIVSLHSQVIDFNSTVYKTLPANAKLSERDELEEKICMLVARRLRDGIHYLKHFKQWMIAKKKTWESLDLLETYSYYFSFLDNSIPAQYRGAIKTIQCVYVFTKRVYQNFVDSQLTTENFAFFISSQNTVRPEMFIDYCFVARCHTTETGQKNAWTKSHQRKTLDTDPPVEAEQPVVPPEKCPADLEKQVFDIQACPAYEEKCLTAFNKYGSKTNPMCPHHCKQVVFQEKTYDPDEKMDYKCGINTDPQGNPFFANSSHTAPPPLPPCDTFTCKTKAAATFACDASFKAVFGTVTVLFGLYKRH